MHQRLVEIKDETFASQVLRGNWGQQRSWNAIL
jgi:hypothetical protein